MASIANEIESIAEFIESEFTSASIHYQRVPTEPKANDLSIRYLMGDTETETNYHYRLDRTYQIVYFAQNELACLTKFDALQRKLNNTFVIPIKDSSRHLRIESFNFSQPFKTEGGTIIGILGVLSVNVREARTQQTHEKINQVTVRIE